MIHLVMWGLLSINPLEIFGVDSDYGAQRCLSSDCTCRVEVPRELPDRVVSSNVTTGTIFFEESSSQLSTSESSRILEYLDKAPGQMYFTVIGYTDGCGSSGYNYVLSLKRANAVKDIIRRNRRGAKVVVRGASEASGQHSPGQRKVNIYSQSTSAGFPAYPEIKADVYLIDASGSMASSFKSWVSAISYSRQPGSKVYISYTGLCRNGQHSGSVSPGGGTEIWYSYWHLLNNMKNGQTLAIISDFDSRIPLTPRERVLIENKVKSKGIRVIGFMP